MPATTASDLRSPPSLDLSTPRRPTRASALFLLALAAMAALDIGLLALLAGALSHIGGLLGAELAIRGRVEGSLRTLVVWTLAAIPLLLTMVRSWRVALRANGPSGYLTLRLGADLFLFASGVVGFVLLQVLPLPLWLKAETLVGKTEMAILCLTAMLHLLASALPLLLIALRWPRQRP